MSPLRALPAGTPAYHTVPSLSSGFRGINAHTPKIMKSQKFASADLSQQRRWLFGFVCEGIKFGSYLFDTFGNRSLCEAECFRNLALRFALELEQDNISVDFVIKRSEKTFCQIDKRRLVIYRLIVPISERFVIGIKLIKGEHLAELGAGVIPFPLQSRCGRGCLSRSD